MNRLSIILLLVLQLSVQDAARADCAEAFCCPDAVQIEELQLARDGYREALAIGQLGEAENLAKQVMKFSIVLNGRDSVDSANALTNLAYVQYRQKQYESSRLNLQAAIITMEESGGYLSADLIRPLHRLGETELALGEVDSATKQFQRAIHIGHVHNGPQNTGQIESLEAIAEIHLDSGRVGAAMEIQESIFAFRARAVGAESEELLPALQHHADWMHKLQYYDLESDTYYKMLSIQENHRGQNDPSLIPTLIVIGRSSKEIGASILNDRPFRHWGGADRYLGRALRIAQNQPQPNWQLRAQTALEVGDFYTRAQSLRRARSAYNDAWQQLSNDPARLTIRREQLESPTLIVNRYLPEYYEDQNPVYKPDITDDFQRGTIIAEFDVIRSGRPVNIKLVESQPPGLTRIEKRLVNAIRYAMHRPRMEDGSTVDTRQLTYVYEFLHREGDSKN